MQMLKPIDVVVLAKVLVLPYQQWNQPRLARELGIPQTNIHRTLKQLERSGLLFEKMPQRKAFFDLVTHGLRYVYPAELGAMSRGMPTAHLMTPELVGGPGYVWPDANGRASGVVLEPLHPSVPDAAFKDPQFYQLMSLIDVFRTGRSRELTLATQQLQQLIRA